MLCICFGFWIHYYVLKKVCIALIKQIISELFGLVTMLVYAFLS